MTRKLYQEDVYKKECESTVLEVKGSGTKEDPFLILLEETIFFPTGGGQPCDLGTIGGIPLAEVFEEGDKIYHKLMLASEWNSASAAVPKAGDRVSCALDWARRFDHMQRHCGEHILSGIFFREIGGVNRGFHMGADYMTIDIDVPGISREEAQTIETLTNEVIWSNVPVTTRYFENRVDAEKLPLRKALAIEEAISIVCVGDESNPADCVACCGTHPSTSGQVGLVKIFRLENYKGMTRVYFDAGRGALEDYQKKQEIIMQLNKKYSSDDSNLLDKMKAQEEKNREVRQELYLMKNTFIAKAAEEILSESGLVIREYPYFNVNDLLAVAKALSEKNSLSVMISTRENILILASGGKPDCGKIVKDNAPVWRGKGGGNATSARAMFPGREDLECFVTYLRQAYQNS
jgi:alanyl-tRNA synthetase